MSTLRDCLAFHHVGFACTDLDAEERVFACFGYTPEGQDFQDPVQGIRGRFLASGGPRLELLSELPGSADDPHAAAADFPNHLVIADVDARRDHEDARLRATTDPHAPGKLRVNGVVQNMPEFGKAFGCPAGQPMVSPRACRVW